MRQRKQPSQLKTTPPGAAKQGRPRSHGQSQAGVHPALRELTTPAHPPHSPQQPPVLDVRRPGGHSHPRCPSPCHAVDCGIMAFTTIPPPKPGAQPPTTGTRGLVVLPPSSSHLCQGHERQRCPSAPSTNVTRHPRNGCPSSLTMSFSRQSGTCGQAMSLLPPPLHPEACAGSEPPRAALPAGAVGESLHTTYLVTNNLGTSAPHQPASHRLHTQHPTQ